MKYILITLLLVIISSCSIKAESDYNRKAWELKTKTIELEYLEKLHRTSSLVELRIWKHELDSLINQRENLKTN